MDRYFVLVSALLYIYVTFSYAEETKEKTISHPESTKCMYVYAPLIESHSAAYVNKNTSY